MPQPTTIHHHPPPPNITHYQPKYIHHHPPPTKIYPPLTTSQDISTNTHHHPPTVKTFFIRNPFIRVSSHCLTARQETYIADLPLLRNFFYMAFSIIFTTYTRNSFKKLQCKRTFILCETSLVLKKDLLKIFWC